MANNPTLLTRPLAEDGQKNTIPDTTTATTGLFSQQYGWQSINSLPPQAGGKAVKREDFNGAFNLLGGVVFMAQKGFTFNFDTTQDYYVGCVVTDPKDGQKYECIADVSAGGSAPSADSTHWQLANNGTDIDAWFRQKSTAYANGAIALLLTLPVGWYLECTGTGGITSANDLVITSPNVGDTVTDGAVVWTIRKIADTTEATTTTHGLMSAADKTKLNGIANNANNYSLPAATGSARGGVTIGSNINLSGDKISINSSNVTNALGYTPPRQDTTYGVVNSSNNGLMTPAMLTKLNNAGDHGTVVAQSLTTNGYRKWSDGFIEQWGRIEGGSSNSWQDTYYPIAFTTAVFTLIGVRASLTGGDAYGSALYPRPVDNTKFQYYNGGGALYPFYWRAVGK